MSEFHRVLTSFGHLVFSVGHPFSDYTYFKSDNYFQTELVASEWSGFGDKKVYMPSFRRSLSETLNPVLDAGFRIEKILEPKPTEEFKRADPKVYDELMQQPVFVCIRARK